MLFNEIYSSYYTSVAKILQKAQNGKLTEKDIYTIVEENAFGESIAVIPDALKKEEWPLLMGDNTTPLKYAPTMPLTNLQKSWLKALLSDPRIALFSVDVTGLEDVEPLYLPDTFVYFDRYGDGDNFADPKYAENFKTVLKALNEKRKLRIKFCGSGGVKHSWICIPERLEYSSKDDKFRLITFSPNNILTVNMGRIKSCKLMEEYTEEEYTPKAADYCELIFELIDERNALERVMRHFSHLNKETKRLEDNKYMVKMQYSKEDETEILIRILSFGPKIKVLEPVSFVNQIKQRLDKQKKLRI